MIWPALPPPFLRSSVARAGCGWVAGVALLALPLSGAPTPTVSTPIFQAQPESRVRIRGHATLGNWECESREVIAAIEPGPELVALANAVSRGARLPQLDAKTFRARHVMITIPVASLQCNKPGMRDDVLRALRHDQAPLVVFVLTGVSDIIVQPHEQAELGRYRVAVRGDLVLAGQLRTIELAADIVQEGARRFRVDAVKELLMSDFDITPPRAALGLIRTDDNVTVSFNLIFELVDPLFPGVAVARTPLP